MACIGPAARAPKQHTAMPKASSRYSEFKTISSYRSTSYVGLAASFGAFLAAFVDLDLGRPDVQPTKAGTFLARLFFADGPSAMILRANENERPHTFFRDNENTRRTRGASHRRRGRRRWCRLPIFRRWRRWRRWGRPFSGRGRRRRWRRFFHFRRFWQRPQMHRHRDVGLNHVLPDPRQYDVTIRPYQIIMPVRNVRADDIDVKESLSDKILHTLDTAARLAYF